MSLRKNLLPAWLAALTMAAAPTALATTINVTAGQNLNQVMEDANDGDVISVGPGTYVAQSTAQYALDPGMEFFMVRKRLTVVSVAGAANTTLVGGAGAAYTAIFFPYAGSNPKGASLTGFRLAGTLGGAAAFDFLTYTGLEDITVRGVIVDPSGLAPGNPSNGISFVNVTNGRIDGATVIGAYIDGISVVGGSGNVVTGNLVQQTSVRNAISIANTARATVTANTVTGAAAHGIVALGVIISRIERNNVSGFRQDGIRVGPDLPGSGAASASNHIGSNRIVSNGWAGGVEVQGSGITVYGNASGNFVFGNDVSGAPEYGIAVYASVSNFVQANRVHVKYKGGIAVLNDTTQSSGTGTRPADSLVRDNFVYANAGNAIEIQDAANTDVGYNFLTGQPRPGDPPNPANAPGTPTPVALTPTGIKATGPVDTLAIAQNSVVALTDSLYLDGGVTGATVLNNRFLSPMNAYAISPAGVVFDGDKYMGGNHWYGHVVTGNPSVGNAPYAGIRCPATSGCSYVDHNPWASPSMALQYLVTVSMPRPGSTLAAGSRKTLRWLSQGCTLVDVDLMSGAAVASALAANYPDVGYFTWDIPNAQPAGSYTLRVTCKDSAGTPMGVAGTGIAFNIAAFGLTLLTPGTYQSFAVGAQVNVAWTRAPGVTGPVTVYANSGSGDVAIALNVTGNSVNIPAPNSAQFIIRIASGVNGDSTDGWVRSELAGTSGGYYEYDASYNQLVGSKVRLHWPRLGNSRYMDLGIDIGGQMLVIAQNVPDNLHYEFLLPYWIWDGLKQYVNPFFNLRMKFKPAPGPALPWPSSGDAGGQSVPLQYHRVPTLQVLHNPSPNPASTGKDIYYQLTLVNETYPPYIYVPTTVKFTVPAGTNYVFSMPQFCQQSAGIVTCSSAAPVVVRPVSAGTATSTVTVTTTIGNLGVGLTTFDLPISQSPPGVPIQRYRLYSHVTQEHHFTTDVNEYNTLGTYGWIQEGEAGKVLDNPGSYGGVTAVPYYRLYNSQQRVHHWTTDSNEYYTLVTLYPSSWKGEGVDGYILPTQAPGTTQLYRLRHEFPYPQPPVHHWTIDANEFNVLTTQQGWIGEGGAGFVVQ